MSDLALIWDGRSCDLALDGNDLQLDDSLQTSILISLFSDRRARADDVLSGADGDRRGWWADAYPQIEGDQIGSRLWLLSRKGACGTPAQGQGVCRGGAGLAGHRWHRRPCPGDHQCAAAWRTRSDGRAQAAGWRLGKLSIQQALGGPLNGVELDSLEQTRQLVGSDIETRLPGTGAQTRRTAAGVIAYAQAGAVHGLHAHIAYRERNFLPDERADAEGVERWAGLLGLWYREPTKASGEAELSGIAGTLLPVGTVLQSAQGVLYATLADATLVGATANVAIQAQGGGASGNLEPGTRLTLLSPAPGIQSTLSVASEA